MKYKSIKVVGQVQGVYFRASAKEQAELLKIKGTVRNEKDGSVFIEAEGENENLEKFIQWCAKGPALARVDRIEVEEGEIKNFSSFEITRF